VAGKIPHQCLTTGPRYEGGSVRAFAIGSKKTGWLQYRYSWNACTAQCTGNEVVYRVKSCLAAWTPSACQSMMVIGMPLLFSMATHPPTHKALKFPKCEMVAAYFNDVVLGAMVEHLGVELPRFFAAALAVGLVLNESKCEIIGLNLYARPK